MDIEERIYTFVVCSKKLGNMVIERINNEIVLRIPSFTNFEEMQRMVDLMRYKEATARSKAKQEDIDKIVNDSKKGWWEKNRNHFIK